MLNNALEMLTELPESYYTHSYGLLQRNDTDQNSQWKKHRGL